MGAYRATRRTPNAGRAKKHSRRRAGATNYRSLWIEIIFGGTLSYKGDSTELAGLGRRAKEAGVIGDVFGDNRARANDDAFTYNPIN